MTKYFKTIRIILSLVILVWITFAFVDFNNLMPNYWYKYPLYTQFVPSILKLIAWAGFASLGFLVVMGLTFLFGRIYCSVLCPLGAFQDVTSRIGRYFQKKARYKYHKPNNVLRYSILAVTVLSMLLGTSLLLSLLDPYSNFGRIASDVFRPIYMLKNNALAWLFGKFGVYYFTPVEIKYVALGALAFPVIVMLTVVAMSVFRGRLYCNTLCPVGTLLGGVSKFSLFKFKMNESKCTKCGKCAVVCKSECINVKDLSVDMSRCVSCFNCVHACSDDAISFSMCKKQTKTEDAIDASKRNFVAGASALVGLTWVTSKVNAQDYSVKKSEVPVSKKNVCAPPGSISREHFSRFCTACHLCVSGCPNKVLQPATLEYGFTGLMQPYLDNTKGFCNFNCTHCGKVCPTGAIVPLTHEEKITTQMGIAKFIQKNCIVYLDETSCGSCAEHCPTQAVHMIKYKGELTIPEVTADICVGCGACEHVCPAKPNKAIYVEGNLVQQVAKKPEIKKVESKAVEEFPF